MVLLAATLAEELTAMVPVETEAEGIENFVTAFHNYFSQSTVLGIPNSNNSEIGLYATNSMKSAMVGISSSGSSKIQAGIEAYWTIIAFFASIIWVTTPPIVSITIPPLLSTIPATLDPVFTSNATGKLSLVDSALAVANALHPLQLGGIATLTPPPPATAPIL